MADVPHVTLEQWRTLAAVVDAGGYARAAERLHKSQSALTYAINKLESQLGVEAFVIQGRKAVLTPTGHLLYRRARALLDEAASAERAAKLLSAGWEAQITIAVEILFPTWLLLSCLDRFGGESPHTRIEVIESVLGGTGEALLEGKADIAIAPRVPPGFLGDLLLRFRALPVANPDHPLHKLGRKLTLRDLRGYRHLLVRDSGSKRDARALSVEIEQRWTVSTMATSILAARLGYGFAWFPEDLIRAELDAGTLKTLPLSEGVERFGELYLILADRDAAGPGTLRLASIIREGVAAECTKHAGEPQPAKRREAPTAA
ncbi:MAG TPA: LysR family transcriptional regulator [Casimicrobiaceae bacterium]|nr:LysR family transcriptional regulator [Casimicrobiaceae bacterium]